MRIAGELEVGTIVIESEKQLLDAISYAPNARYVAWFTFCSLFTS